MARRRLDTAGFIIRDLIRVADRWGDDSSGISTPRSFVSDVSGLMGC